MTIERKLFGDIYMHFQSQFCLFIADVDSSVSGDK